VTALIVARLTGGLGNQLFQYAAACGIAHESGGRVALDVSAFRNGEETRAFALGRFDLGAPLLAGSAFDADFRTALIPAQAGEAALALPVQRENQYEFEPATKALGGSAYLYGFWQSWRYFAALRDRLRQLLASVPSHPEISPSDESVAIHVRRGDYLDDGVRRAFGACEPGYYAAAMAYLRTRLASPRFFLFSDDPLWCAAQFAAPDVTIMSRSGGDAVDDLASMACCRHHVIANSSLSWWGAWLGEGAQSIVIAPIPWYNQSPQVGDLLPDHWIRLNRASGAAWAAERRRVGGTVSVIVLDRGDREMLRRAIASAEAQTHKVLELLVETAPSAGTAFDAGIAKARGDWVALLDARDTWLPDKLRIELETAYLTGADAVDCRTIPVAGPDGLPEIYPPPGRPDCDLAGFLRAGRFIAGMSHTIARRDVLAKLGRFADDWTPEAPGAAWAGLLARPSTVMLWQRLVRSPIPWLARRP